MLVQMKEPARKLDIRDWVCPFMCGVAASALCFKWGHVVVQISDDHGWHLDQLYTAAFGFLSVTTGFLATFYATLQSTTEGFVHRIRETKGRTLEKFLVLTKAMIILGFVAAIACVPMMVTIPMPTDGLTIATATSSFCFGLTTWAIIGFVSIAKSFFRLLETPAPPRRGAG